MPIYLARTANDWGNLVLQEIRGGESPGTVSRLIREARGDTSTETADIGLSAYLLVRLAESLQAPELIRKQINELASAAAASKAEAESIKAEQKKLQAAGDALNDLRVKHEAEMTKRTAEAEAACNKREQEANEIHAKAAAVLKAAEADAKKNAAIRADLERRLDLIRAA
jgi:hypothetical protein